METPRPGIGPVEIRPVRAAEHDLVADLLEETYRTALGDLLGEDYLAVLRDVARRADEAVVLVAADAGQAGAAGGTVLGTVTYVPEPGPWHEFDDHATAGIRMLAVAPRAQGRGIGRALVEACLARAAAEGRPRVGLHTVSLMVDAMRLYERLGFHRAPDHDWTLPSGTKILAYELKGWGPGPD